MKTIKIFSKHLIAFALILSAFSLATAQEENGLNLLSGEYSILQSQPSFGLQMGSSFTTGMGGNSLFSQSIAPNMQLDVTKNFQLVVGSVFTTGNLGNNGSMQLNSGMEVPQRLNSTMVYAMGAYQMNPRLTITGAAWTERNNMNAFQNQMNPQAFNTNARGMMMGVDYKITENLRFGAEVNISNGRNPFSPYGNYGSNPFYSNPFHRRTSW
ncbi:MAG: hypothetical protein ACLFQS_01265 [Bacteroidales bacterium]